MMVIVANDDVNVVDTIVAAAEAVAYLFHKKFFIIPNYAVLLSNVTKKGREDSTHV